MILTRFWFLLLAFASAIGFAAALMTASLVNDHYRTGTVNDLIRDRLEIEQALKLDARARIDAIAPVAAQAQVRTALRRANERASAPELSQDMTEPLRQELQRLNGQLGQMSGDLLLAVDKGGRIVAGIAPERLPPRAAIGQFPLVQRALSGFLRDDVWLYNNQVYRMAARPVVDGGRYVGALVHGKRFDDTLAKLLSDRVNGASIGFFSGDNVFAGHMPPGAPRGEEMGRLLSDQVLEDEQFVQGKRTEALEMPSGALAIYSRVTGSASFAGVGYAIGRPLKALDSPWAVFDDAGGERVGSLPWVSLTLGFLVAFLLGMLWIWLERGRPLRRLNEATKGLADTSGDRLTTTQFSGRYRLIAESVNDALDMAATAAGAEGPNQAAANLDELLGPATSNRSDDAFFGFNGQDKPANAFREGNTEISRPAAAVPEAGSTEVAPAPTPPAVGPTVPSRPGAMVEPRRPRPPGPPAVRPSPPPSQKPPSEAPLKPPPRSSKQKLKSTLLGVAPPEDEPDEHEGEATMVARVPRELLERSAAGPADEAAHFREVFEKFIATQKECGESASNLTFSKFRGTLEKNRDQIMKRHGAARVRFTVYKKNGKAALKATPIKR